MKDDPMRDETTNMPLLWKASLGAWIISVIGVLIAGCVFTMAALGTPTFQGAHPPGIFLIGLGVMGWGAMISVCLTAAAIVEELRS